MRQAKYDAIIVGGGPAGLSAAIYMARAQYRVLVVEKDRMGGQITISSEVVNYPGIPSTDGRHLTQNMRKQAESFGAEFLMAEVTELELEQTEKTVVTEKGAYTACGIILATGAHPRLAGFRGEKEYQGRGVAYCATCDGEFFTGMDVFVIGGGYAAAEEAVFLTRFAKKVIVLVREEDFTCAGSMADEVRKTKGIEVHYETQMQEVGGDGMLRYAVYENLKTGKVTRYEAESGMTFGVFVFVGYAPETELFKDKVTMSEYGYLETDARQQTSIPGVYGAGDVCVKDLRQVVTAVSDGAVAATSLERYLHRLYEEKGIGRAEKPVRQKIHIMDMNEAETESQASDEGHFLTEEMKAKLAPVFERMEKKVLVKVFLDDSRLSGELRAFAGEITGLTDKIQVAAGEDGEAQMPKAPALAVCDEQGKYLGVAFHGVPGGHEFNSFIIALYNAAGPGQEIDSHLLHEVSKLQGPLNIKIAVSLSCTMCPDVVMAAQKLALHNKNIRAEMYDLAWYPKLKAKYRIMSVPCLIINDEQVSFGRKNKEQILELLQSAEKEA